MNERFDRNLIESVDEMEHSVHIHDFGRISMLLIESFPTMRAGQALRTLAQMIVERAESGGKIIVMMGAHVIKTGCAPFLIEMMRRRWITSIAMNGAAAIHDAEIAAYGHTSEDIAANLPNGTFGMYKPTVQIFQSSLDRAYLNITSLGEALGIELNEMLKSTERRRYPRCHYSVVAMAHALEIPCTIHIAIGTDTIHMHPEIAGDKLGITAMIDFERFIHKVCDMDYGVVLNIGSAVIMPEVFLKAVAVCMNQGGSMDFAAANFDVIQQYRPNMNILDRSGADPTFRFTGHHEIMIPLLYAMCCRYSGMEDPTYAGGVDKSWSRADKPSDEDEAEG